MRRLFQLMCVAILLCLLLSLASSRAVQGQTLADDAYVPDGQMLLLKGVVKGVQLYVCAASGGDAPSYAWTLKGPNASVYNADGIKIGSLRGGPTWESVDGSSVVGSTDEGDA